MKSQLFSYLAVWLFGYLVSTSHLRHCTEFVTHIRFHNMGY